MTDLTGMELKGAEEYLEKNSIEYRIKYTAAPKPLGNTDSVFVIRHKISGNTAELTVSKFKTKVSEL